MRRLLILTVCLLAGLAYGWIPQTNTTTYLTTEADGDWDQFRFTIVNDNDQVFVFGGDADVTGYGIYLRFSDGPSTEDTAYLTLDTNSAITISTTNITCSMVSTNVPPPRAYFVELLAYTGTGNTTKYRTLAQGKVNTVWSALAQTNTWAQGALPTYMSSSYFTQDGGFLVGMGSGTYQEETGTVARASIGAAAATDVTALQTATNAMTGRIGDNETATNAITVRVTANETATNALTTRVGTLETNTNTLDTAIDTLETATNAITVRVGALETNTNTLDSAVTDLETATNAITDRVTANETATNALTDRVTDNETATNAITDRVSDLETATNANAQLTIDDVLANGGTTGRDMIRTNGSQTIWTGIVNSSGKQLGWAGMTDNGNMATNWISVYNSDSGDYINWHFWTEVPGGIDVDYFYLGSYDAKRGIIPAVSNDLWLGSDDYPFAGAYIEDGSGIKDIATLNTATNAIAIRVGTLETNTNSLDTAIGTLETATNAITARVTANETATNAITDRVVTLEAFDLDDVLANGGTTGRDMIRTNGSQTIWTGIVNSSGKQLGWACMTDNGNMATNWISVYNSDSGDYINWHFWTEVPGGIDVDYFYLGSYDAKRGIIPAVSNDLWLGSDDYPFAGAYIEDGSGIKDIATLNTATNAITDRVTANETATNAITDRVDALESNTNTLDTAVTDLQTATNALDSGKQDVDADLTALAVYDGCGNAFTNFGSIQVNGNISGELPITLDTDNTVTLVAEDCRGKLRINNDDDAIDYTLPTAEAGLVVSFGNHLYAQIITVDAAAGDIIILNDGTALDAADAADSSGAADDKGTFIAVDDTYWIIWGEQNEWVDGDAD